MSVTYNFLFYERLHKPHNLQTNAGIIFQMKYCSEIDTSYMYKYLNKLYVDVFRTATAVILSFFISHNIKQNKSIVFIFYIYQ